MKQNENKNKPTELFRYEIMFVGIFFFILKESYYNEHLKHIDNNRRFFIRKAKWISFVVFSEKYRFILEEKYIEIFDSVTLGNVK